MHREILPDQFTIRNALFNRDLKRLADLLNQGECIDLSDESDKSALHLATSLGYTEAVDLLLEHCCYLHFPNCYLDLPNEFGETPLHIAIKNKNVELAGKLLKRGADGYAPDKQCNSPLMLAVLNNFEAGVDLFFEGNVDALSREIFSSNIDGYTCHHLLVLQKNSNLLEKFLKKGHMSTVPDSKGRCPLQLAIVEDFQRGFELLLEETTHLFAQDDNGHTVLHSAVLQKNYAIIEQLINNEMSESILYIKDHKKNSALDLAVSNNVQFAICLFLKKGVDSRDGSDETSHPLHMAVLNNNKTWLRELIRDGCEIDTKDNKNRTLLHWAILRNFAPGINILLSKGANVNAEDAFGNTALYYAILGKCTDFVEILVNKGADINHKNNDRISPIHLAVTGNFQAGVNLLLSKGADVNVRDGNRNTVLHTAVLSGPSKGNEIVKMLLKHDGVDLDALNSNAYTSLHLAVKEGLESVVELLLDKGVDVNFRNESSLTALHTAICQDKDKRNITIVKKLCENGADLEIKTSNSETPLNLAAYHKYTSAVKLLLEKGATTNEAGADGNTALHYAVIQPFDQHESRLIVHMLLSIGADVNKKNHAGQTVIHTASSSGFESVVSFLVEWGANVHELDNNDSSVLHKAVDAGEENKELVEQLLSLGLDPNLMDLNMRPPLHLAVQSSFDDSVKLLLAYGANVNDTGSYNQLVLPLAGQLPYKSILEHLIDHGTDVNQKNDIGTALHSAVISKRYENVTLLLKNNIRVNEVNTEGETALHAGCRDYYYNGSNEVVVSIFKILIEHGADVNVKTINGKTVLHLASHHMIERVVKLFLDNNAKINEQDSSGNTALHIAALKQRVGIVKLLVDSGADLTLKNNNGKTVLHLVVKLNLPCLDLILNNYSAINAQDVKGNTCLHDAVLQRYLHTVKVLLLNNIDIDLKNEDKLTATHLAASTNFQSVVRLLLERETQTSQTNVRNEEALLLHSVLKRNRRSMKRLISRNIDINYKKTKSALHLAVLRNFEFGVDALIQSGAHVNDKDSNGNTPLHLAAIVGNATITNTLLSNGASLHSRNEDNRTAVHLASLTDFKEGVEMLLDRGALLDLQDCDGNTPLHLAMSKESSILASVLIQSGARMDIINRREMSFFSMRSKSEVSFRRIEELFVKLKIAYGENGQSEYGAHWAVDYPHNIDRLETVCEEEVSKMKSHRFGEKTLLDVLEDHKDPQFILIGQLKDMVDRTSLEVYFPNYAPMIKARFKRLERRYYQLNEASTIPILVENCSGKIIDLPTEVKRKIMSELSDEDLFNVLEIYFR